MLALLFRVFLHMILFHQNMLKVWDKNPANANKLLFYNHSILPYTTFYPHFRIYTSTEPMRSLLTRHGRKIQIVFGVIFGLSAIAYVTYNDAVFYIFRSPVHDRLSSIAV